VLGNQREDDLGRGENQNREQLKLNVNANFNLKSKPRFSLFSNERKQVLSHRKVSIISFVLWPRAGRVRRLRQGKEKENIKDELNWTVEIPLNSSNIRLPFSSNLIEFQYMVHLQQLVQLKIGNIRTY